MAHCCSWAADCNLDSFVLEYYDYQSPEPAHYELAKYKPESY